MGSLLSLCSVGVDTNATIQMSTIHSTAKSNVQTFCAPIIINYIYFFYCCVCEFVVVVYYCCCFFFIVGIVVVVVIVNNIVHLHVHTGCSPHKI